MKEGKGSLGVLPKFYMDGENVLDIKDKDDITKLKTVSGRSQDGGGIGRGDHFLFYKFIERTTER